MRIGLLICDHVREQYRAISGDYPEMFVRLFAAYPDVEIVLYDVINGEIPESPDECEAWLTTGSRHSVNDDHQWIRDLEAFVRRAARTGVPFVGICFGHQLIARALGGSVVRSRRGWGLGMKEVVTASSLDWADPPKSSYRVLNSHKDEVESLPPDGTVLGWAEDCPVSMMGVGETMLGIQGHPEMDRAYVEALIRDRGGTIIPEETAAAALESLDRDPDTEILAAWILEFISRAVSVTAVQPPSGSVI
jgi:GMP synthase-like glutamine amidotransferase